MRVVARYTRGPMLLLAALRNLLRNLRRTTAVLVTVALGTGALFLFHGFNAGIMNQYRENSIRARYGHGQVNQKAYRERVYEKPWEHWVEATPELRAKLAKAPGVTQLFPRVGFSGLLTNGRITVSGVGQGIDGVEEAKFFSTLNVEQGKLLSDEQDGILLGRGLARSLDLKVGDRVTLLTNTIHGSMNGADFQVTGIFHTGAKDFDDVLFRVQLSQAQQLLDTTKVESIALGLRSLEDWPAVAAHVAKELPELDAIPFAELDKVYYQHSVDWLASQFRVFQFIILTIVVLGIFNTISTGILERKQEIGNLRANGESVFDVMTLLGLEGAALGVAGAIVGLLLAVFVTYVLIPKGILMPPAPGITRQFYVRVEPQPPMAVVTFAMGTICALVGTLLAGLRVAKMPIGEALRST